MASSKVSAVASSNGRPRRGMGRGFPSGETRAWVRGAAAAAAAWVLGGIGPAPAMANDLVPVGHDRPPLRVQVWTDREEQAVYYPGEAVTVHVTTNDGAYVLVYDIDTEGRVRQLFPPPGDPGYVNPHEVITLPGPQADFDWVVTGPPGIETIEAVASRMPLLPWSGPEPRTEGDDDEWEGDEEFEGPPPRDQIEDGEYDGEYEEGDEDWDDGEWEEGIWRSPTGAQVSGDPYLAIDRMNHRVLPEASSEGDYATDFVTFCVGRRVSYPRYACNDCHGAYPAFDPYMDACSVFRVEVNVAWYPPPTGVYGVHPPIVQPRYVYVRREHVPVRYKHLKTQWSGFDRKQIDRELKPMVKAVRRPSYKATTKYGAPTKGQPETKIRTQKDGYPERDLGKVARERSAPERKVRADRKRAEWEREAKREPAPELRRSGRASRASGERPARVERMGEGRKSERVEEGAGGKRVESDRPAKQRKVESDRPAKQRTASDDRQGKGREKGQEKGGQKPKDGGGGGKRRG